MADKVRVGLIGSGGMACAHVRWLSNIPEAEITALNDPSDAAIRKAYERCAEQAPDLNKVPVYRDYKELLADPNVDAVQIHSPHTVHFQQALDALAAGKHVLLEKPMVTKTEHAHTLLDAWNRSGKVLMISYQRHFQKEFRYARQVIQSGGLGKIEYIQAFQGQEWLRATRGSWRQTQELSGGGQINDSGSHLIDIILWVSGLRVAEVAAYQDFFDVPVDINTAAAIKFTNGALGTLSIIGNAPRWREDITFYGSEGAIYIRQGQPLVHQDAKGQPVNTQEIGESTTPDRNWIDAILGRAEVEVPPTCGLAVIELTEAAWESAKADGKPTPVVTRSR
jgi:predicted dehydrogenase